MCGLLVLPVEFVALVTTAELSAAAVVPAVVWSAFLEETLDEVRRALSALLSALMDVILGSLFLLLLEGWA